MEWEVRRNGTMIKGLRRQGQLVLFAVASPVSLDTVHLASMAYGTALHRIELLLLLYLGYHQDLFIF